MPTHRNRRRAVALALALAAAPATMLAGARPARADVVDRVVAVVEDDAIFLSDLERRVRPFERELERMDNERERAERREQLYRETVERMVDDALIRRAATRAHITVTDADVDRMIEGIARQRNATAQDIYDALQREGINRSEYRTFMEAEVLRLRVLNQRVRGRVNITEADIAEEYRRRVRDLNDHAPFHAAHVFIAFPDHPSATQIIATQRRAEEVARRLRAGEDFALVARTMSDDEATREAGGDLGTVDPAAEPSEDENAQPPPPAWLVNAFRDLQPGQISPAVRGENGYHVFRLIGRDPVNIPALQSVRSQLYNELLNREMARQQRLYLRELRRHSTVDVRL